MMILNYCRLKRVGSLVLILIVACNRLFAQNAVLDVVDDLDGFVRLAVKTSWDTVKNKNGIILRYRTLRVNDEIETREVSVSFTVSSPVGNIIKHIREPYSINKWNEGTRNNVVLSGNDTSWILYARYDIPYPFPQQDIVSKYTIKKDGAGAIIYTRSLPAYIAAKEDVKREQYNWGRWELSPKSNGDVDVSFHVVTLSNTSIPRFIKDPLIQYELMNSFYNLKNLLG